MSPHAKDPLLVISVLLAITGTVQASTGLLSALAARHPLYFGLAMTAISVVTAVLTVLKTNLAMRQTPPQE
jgi:hypothetical protein